MRFRIGVTWAWFVIAGCGPSEMVPPMMDMASPPPSPDLTSRPDVGERPDLVPVARLGIDTAPEPAKLAGVQFGRAVESAFAARSLAVLAHADKDVTLLDLSDAAQPKLGDTIATPAKVTAMEADEGRRLAFAVDDSGRVSAIGLPGLAAASLRATAQVAALAGKKPRLARAGSRLFALAGTTVASIDVQGDEAQTTLAMGAATTLPTAPAHFATGGGRLYFALPSGVVEAWTVGANGALAKAAQLDLTGEITGLVAQGARVLASVRGAGLRVIDFAVPSTPRLAFQETELNDVASLSLFGPTLLAGLQRGVLTAIDVADLSAPRAVASLRGALPGMARVVAGNLLSGTGTDGRVSALPPLITARLPGAVAAGFPLDGLIPLQFSKALSPASLAMVALRDGANAIPGRVVLTPDGLGLAFRPDGLLPAGRTLAFDLSAVRDLVGTPFVGAAMSITTAAAAPAPIVQPGSAYAHTVDGSFTDWREGLGPNDRFEWFDVTPARGSYSVFYADFDGSWLSMMNDWFWNGDGIDPACYNRFEAWTGEGAEQWEVRAYGDGRIEVRLNGDLIDPMMKGVKGGAGFGPSPNLATPHTTYEIRLPASPGGWGVRLHDPGPTFGCDRLATDPTTLAGMLTTAAGGTLSLDSSAKPAAPQTPALAIADGAVDLALAPTLAWNAADPWSALVGYLVEIGTSPDFTTGIYQATAVAPRFTVPAGLLRGDSTYYWRVTSWNSGGSVTTAARSFSTTVNCGVGLKVCNRMCIAAAACCDASECAAPMHASATCANNACGFACDQGYSPCLNSCVDLQVDPAHCGACNAACPMAQSCAGGQCKALSCTPGYKTQTMNATSASPSGIAGGYFNADLNVDVVVADSWDMSVSVYLGNGDGTLQPRVSYPTTKNPYRIAVADYNGDGKPDLAVASYGGGADGQADVLLGNGDGTFQPAISNPAPFAFGIAAGRLDGDANVDLVVAAQGPGAHVLLGKGDGTFGAPTTLAAGGSDLDAVIGEFSGDGKNDFAVADENGSVYFFVGNGDGTFAAGTALPAGLRPHGIVAADLNHDNKLDLAVADYGPGSMGMAQIFLGHGDGTFDAAVGYATSGSYSYSIALASVNRDGHTDLLISDFAVGEGFSILLGKGDGTFDQANTFGNGGGGHTVIGVDLNADGLDDSVWSAQSPGALQVMLNDCK